MTILCAFIISLVLNLSLFLVAYKLQSDKLTDISYALTFVVLAIAGYWNSPVSLYHMVLFAMICAWGFRIGGFLLYRVLKVGKDARFDEMRGSFVKFGQFWVLQGLTVPVLMLAATLAFTKSASITTISMIGAVVWLIGLVIEGIADVQKDAFNSKAKNKGKWIDEGIWSYSRHPNYFGEILVWVGVYLFCLPTLTGLDLLIGLLSPLFITILLLFVSGIPILEKSADKKWGDNAAYKKYKKRTSILIPLPKKSA